MTNRVTTIDDNSNMRNNNNTKEKNTMKITESKTEVQVENVKPMEPQIVRILDNKGIQVAFVCIGYKSTSIHIGICQEDNFELELNRELV